MLDINSEEQVAQKPCIALMGEFSAGKSTLSNLMLGAKPLPERVTATQLPPVWITHGTQEAYREDLEGNRHPVFLDRLEEVPLTETLYIKIFLETDILTLCDLIDMPGISDPNMPPEVWQRMVAQADSVLWCTHATQAWRQSEAAVWDTMPVSLHAKSLLLVTRIDKILTDRDRKKLLRRVASETEGLFSDIFPISLLAAVAAGEDHEKWEASGAEAFTDRLIDLIQELVVEKEQLAQNADHFNLEAPYTVAENAGLAPVDRMGDIKLPEEEATPAVESVKEPAQTAELALAAQPDGVTDGGFDYAFDKTFDDDFGTSYSEEFEEGGDGFIAQEEGPADEPGPLRLDPDAHMVATSYLAQPEAPVAAEPDPMPEKKDRLPPLAPPESALPGTSVMPRRVKRSGTGPRAERMARPPADSGIGSERPKAALSPLSSLSNLRGVFAQADETRQGRTDT